MGAPSASKSPSALSVQAGLEMEGAQRYILFTVFTQLKLFALLAMLSLLSPLILLRLLRPLSLPTLLPPLTLFTLLSLLKC